MAAIICSTLLNVHVPAVKMACQERICYSTRVFQMDFYFPYHSYESFPSVTKNVSAQLATGNDRLTITSISSFFNRVPSQRISSIISCLLANDLLI